MPNRSGAAKAVARPLTVSKRKAIATAQLVDALAAADKDTALTAALEILTERLAADTTLSGQLHARYHELEAVRDATRKQPPAPAPVPISGPDLDHFNPYARPDPYKLLDWYGRDQFRAVIVGATVQSLRELVDAVQAREPGARPASRSKKQDMIDYLVEHVAGHGY
jgi:hypothetical protein